MREPISFVRSEAVLLAAIAVIAGAVWAFIDIAEDSAETEGRAFDLSILQWLHPGPDLSDPLGPAWFDHAMRDLTSLGSLAVLGAMALIATGYLLLQKQKLEAASLFVSLGGGLALSQMMKDFFERTRPPMAYHATEYLNASFPSGHALLSTVVYLTLGAMLARAAKRRGLKIYVLAIAVILAATVGVSRVYLGVHWASDVLAGWSLGAAWAATCWLVERWIARKLRPVAEAQKEAQADAAA